MSVFFRKYHTSPVTLIYVIANAPLHPLSSPLLTGTFLPMNIATPHSIPHSKHQPFFAAAGLLLQPGAWSAQVQPQPLLAAVMPHTMTLLRAATDAGTVAADRDAAADDSLKPHDVPPIALVIEESLIKVFCCCCCCCCQMSLTLALRAASAF
jgi:hypothetical protein